MKHVKTHKVKQTLTIFFDLFRMTDANIKDLNPTSRMGKPKQESDVALTNRDPKSQVSMIQTIVPKEKIGQSKDVNIHQSRDANTHQR